MTYLRALLGLLAIGISWTEVLTAAPGMETNLLDLARERATSITTNRLISEPIRRTFALSNQIFVSTDFDGARLSDVHQTGPGQFQGVVAAENYPVNDSPWFGFKIWAASNQPVAMELNYDRTVHRYHARVSHDRVNWKPVNDIGGSTAVSKTNYGFTLDIGPEPLYVAAQELFTSADFDHWIQEIAALPFARSRVLGTSTLGKPLHLLEITEAKGAAESVFIVGRQHPPEVTGTLALRDFVGTICGNSPLALEFRKRFKVTLVPVVNPDGVDAGHWRHNARGADLNRDWGQFNQVETRLVRDLLTRVASENPGKLRMALDFHSTDKDVFYVSLPNAANGQADVVWEWLRGLRQRVPDHPVDTDHFPPNSSRPTLSFTSWINRALGVPAITYEVGDKTDRKEIRRVAQGSAESMMTALVQDTPGGRDSHKLRVALYKGAGTGGKGPPNMMNYFDAHPNVLITQVKPEEIQKGILRYFDVVIFAGGSASVQGKAIGEDGQKQVRGFVENGGGYVGICAGSYLASSGFSWGLRLLDARTISSKWQRGVGEVKMELTERGQEVLAHLPGQLSVHYANGPILKPDEAPDLRDYEVLAWFRTELAENDSPKGIMAGSPAIVSGTLGRGRVICFSPHPEQTKGLELLIDSGVLWAGGKPSVGIAGR